MIENIWAVEIRSVFNVTIKATSHRIPLSISRLDSAVLESLRISVGHRIRFFVVDGYCKFIASIRLKMKVNIDDKIIIFLPDASGRP